MSQNSYSELQRRARRSTLVMVTCWLLLMGGLYLLMQAYLQPSAPVVQADGSLRIERGRDGHFRAPGLVNGEPVIFLVDTGASMVSVTDELASQAGLVGGEAVEFQTANGRRMGRIDTAQSVQVGALQLRQVRVGTGYTGESSRDALLGQSFLRHFDVSIRRDYLELHSR